MPCGVLDEDSDEALHGAEGCTVDHHGAVLLVVSTRVLEVEALRQVVVYLDRTELPAAAKGVLDHEVQLRPVEGGFAVLDLGGKALLSTSLDDSLLGALPVLFATDVLLAVHLIAQGDLSLEVLEVQRLEDDEDDIHHLAELLLDLVGAAEEVRVVLREATYTRQPVELTALLVAIDRTELSQTLGQVTIGVRAESLEDLTVVRAVHRLEHKLFALLRRGDGAEGVCTVLSPVTRGDVELLRADMWRDNLLIAELLLDLLEEVLQTQAELRTARQPQGQP